MDLLSEARERLDRGDYAGARDAADRALSDAGQAGDQGAKVDALAILGEALLGLGDPFGAREALEATYRLAWAPEAPWEGSAPIMQDLLAEARAGSDGLARVRVPAHLVRRHLPARAPPGDHRRPAAGDRRNCGGLSSRCPADLAGGSPVVVAGVLAVLVAAPFSSRPALLNSRC